MAPDGGTGGGTELFLFELCGILEFIRFLLGLLGFPPVFLLIKRFFPGVLVIHKALKGCGARKNVVLYSMAYLGRLNLR